MDGESCRSKTATGALVERRKSCCENVRKIGRWPESVLRRKTVRTIPSKTPCGAACTTIKSMAESDKRRNSVQSVAAEINFVPGGVFRSVPRTNVEKNSVVSGNACDIRETSPTSRMRGEECPDIRAFTFTHPGRSTSKHKRLQDIRVSEQMSLTLGTEGTGALANHIDTPALLDGGSSNTIYLHA